MGGGCKPPDSMESLSSVVTTYGCFRRDCSRDGSRSWLMLKYSHFPPRTVPLPAPHSQPDSHQQPKDWVSVIAVIHHCPSHWLPGILGQKRRKRDCDSRRNDAGEYTVPDVHCAVDPVKDKGVGRGDFKEAPVSACVYEHVSVREGRGREEETEGRRRCVGNSFTSLCLLCWRWSGRWLEGSVRSWPPQGTLRLHWASLGFLEGGWGAPQTQECCPGSPDPLDKFLLPVNVNKWTIETQQKMKKTSKWIMYEFNVHTKKDL